MSTEKEKPLIDFSHANEKPRSMNLDKMADTGEIHRDDDQKQEIEENVAEHQMNIANIPGACTVSQEKVE